MIKTQIIPGLGLVIEVSISPRLGIFVSRDGKGAGLSFDDPFEKEAEFIKGDEKALNDSSLNPNIIAFIKEVSEIPEIKKIATEKDCFLSIHSDKKIPDEVLSQIVFIYHCFIDDCDYCKKVYFKDKEASRSATGH